MTTANKFVADVVKTAREKVIEAIEDSTSNAVGELLQVDEGSLALLEVAYGASNVKTRDDMASFVSDSSGTLFDAMVSGSRRKMNDPLKHTEESYALRQSNSDDESIVEMQFGVVHEQAHQTLLNKLKKDGLLRASIGFDINEFGLFDESSATILECINTYTEDTVSSIVHCSGSCNYCESTTASSFAGTFAVTSNYARNQNCKWLISAPRTITLQFSSLDTELNNDFVTINRCSSQYSSSKICSSPQKIDKLSGQDNTGNSYLSTSASPEGHHFLEIIFSSDSSTAKGGLSASWSIAAPSPSEDCKVVFRGSNVELNVRIVVRKEQFSTELRKDMLLAAVRKVCDFRDVDWRIDGNQEFASIAKDIANRVQFVQTIEIQCSNNLCLRSDINIQATSNEIKSELKKKLSLDSFQNAYNSIDSGRQGLAVGILSMEICEGICGACPPGQYDSTGTASDASAIADAICVQCPVGTYSEKGILCASCPPYSTSAIGSSSQWSCSCNAGFILSGTETCTACDAGKFAQGQDNCVPCIEGKYSVASASTSCASCEAGKYKAVIGAGTCSNCLAGQYSTVVGAMSDVCEDCPANSNAPAASDDQTDCICIAGKTSCPTDSVSPAGSFNLTDSESVYVVVRPRILPAASKFTGFVEIAVMADEPVVMTTDGQEPSCNSALSSTMKSHIVTLLTSSTVKAIACDLSRNMFSETSLAQFEVLPSSVVQVSFTIAGSSYASPADLPEVMIKKFVNAFANELGISKDRISNIEVRDARRRLLDVQMIFYIASNSESNAKFLAEKV